LKVAKPATVKVPPTMVLPVVGATLNVAPKLIPEAVLPVKVKTPVLPIVVWAALVVLIFTPPAPVPDDKLIAIPAVVLPRANIVVPVLPIFRVPVAFSEEVLAPRNVKMPVVLPILTAPVATL